MTLLSVDGCWFGDDAVMGAVVVVVAVVVAVESSPAVVTSWGDVPAASLSRDRRWYKRDAPNDDNVGSTKHVPCCMLQLRTRQANKNSIRLLHSLVFHIAMATVVKCCFRRNKVQLVMCNTSYNCTCTNVKRTCNRFRQQLHCGSFRMNPSRTAGIGTI